MEPDLFEPPTGLGMDPDMTAARVVSVSDSGIVELSDASGATRLVAIPLEKVPSYRRLCRYDTYLASEETAQAGSAVD